MDVPVGLSVRAAAIEGALERLIPGTDVAPRLLHEAMRYSLLGGGKRLRGALVLLSCGVVGGEEKGALPIAAAVEAIHAYSLIHDDLPCMDDDDFRRGKPSNHKVYGEAVAVLAGDALLTLAFELLSEVASEDTADQQERALAVIREIACAAGSRGLVGGQVVDLQSEGKIIGEETLEFIHRCKTGALLRASVRAGAIWGGANGEKLQALTEYAENLGLCFQIVDDLLDVVGDEARLGKKVGADRARGKATFPALYGVEQSRRMVAQLVDQGKKALRTFGNSADELREILEFVARRDH